MTFLITLQWYLSRAGIYYAVSEQSVLTVDALEAGKMGKRKDLSDFEKGLIVMARRLGQSISQTADLVGCSRSAVVSTYQKWSKEGQPVNRRQGHGRPRLIDASGEQKLADLVQSHTGATVAQIAEKVNDGEDNDRKVSAHTVHRSLLRMGLRRRRPDRASMLTPVQRRKRIKWTMEQWTKEEGLTAVLKSLDSFSL